MNENDQRIMDLTAERDYYRNSLRELFDQLHEARLLAARATIRLSLLQMQVHEERAAMKPKAAAPQVISDADPGL